MLDRLELARTELKRRIEILKVDWDRERQELLRQLAEQGEKLKAAEAESDSWARSALARAAELQSLNTSYLRADADINRQSKLRHDAEAERNGLKARLAEVLQTPDTPEWVELVRMAYKEGGDGATRINRITAEHNRVRAQVKALERERDGLRAQLARTAIPTHPQTAAQLLAASLNVSEEKVRALEQRIAGAKVCSHIYTRVALTSTTTCPACTNGIVWPEPAERIAAPKT